mmetsp:Transcript_78159/g.137704  ORF Transcript_78159/g.137704 Transcript_78159/m.137704 type:complete len:106 (+) Transcript_78159:406-723(+)
MASPHEKTDASRRGRDEDAERFQRDESKHVAYTAMDVSSSTSASTGSAVAVQPHYFGTCGREFACAGAKKSSRHDACESCDHEPSDHTGQILEPSAGSSTNYANY